MELTSKAKKNHIQLRKEMKDGVEIEYIMIDGNPAGILGVSSEEDRAAAISTLEKAYEASDGNVFRMLKLLNNIANDNAKGISPDEVIEIAGREYEIVYSESAAYVCGGDKFVEIDDVDVRDCPAEVIKSMLVYRIKDKLHRLEAEERAAYESRCDDVFDDYDEDENW